MPFPPARESKREPELLSQDEVRTKIEAELIKLEPGRNVQMKFDVPVGDDILQELVDYEYVVKYNTSFTNMKGSVEKSYDLFITKPSEKNNFSDILKEVKPFGGSWGDLEGFFGALAKGLDSKNF